MGLVFGVAVNRCRPAPAIRYGLMGLAVATSVHLIVNFMLRLMVLERVTPPTRAPDVELRHSLSGKKEMNA
jgi:hypothetical protein